MFKEFCIIFDLLQGNLTYYYRQLAGRWRIIQAFPTTDVCMVSERFKNFLPFQILKRLILRYVPNAPTECPILKGRYDFKFIIEDDIKEEDRFWGNFFLPTGLYKVRGNMWTKDDPVGGFFEYTIEVKPKQGRDSEIDW